MPVRTERRLGFLRLIGMVHRRGPICVALSPRAVTRHPFVVARHCRRPAIGFASRYRWSAAAKAPRSCRSAGFNNPHAMRASTSRRNSSTLMHVIPRRRRSRYQRIRRAPAETTGTLSEVMLFSDAGRFEPNAMTAFTLKLFSWVICKPRPGSFQTSQNWLAILNRHLRSRFSSLVGLRNRSGTAQGCPGWVWIASQ